MRRVIAVLVSLAALATGASAVAVAPPAGAQVPRDDPSRGLIYSGLRRADAASPCRGGYEIISRRRDVDTRRRGCTHGPDPIPAGVDLRPGQDPTFTRGETSPSGTGIAATGATGTVGCYGNGTDGYRVQLMYARESGTPDRFVEYENRFRQWAAYVDDIFNASAAKTGGIRHVRYVTDSQCRPTIERITLPAGAVNDFSDTLDELDHRGFDRVDRKYLIWVDTTKTGYCGIATTWDDYATASATPGLNANNGNPDYGPFVARVDTPCWGQSHSTEAHELLHTLGGVLGWSNPAEAPPHATNAGHCTDESDRLCYADGEPGVFKPDGSRTSLQFLCPGTHEVLLDCRNDDYFSTNPPAGNWLATHWNTANSAWLARGPAAGTSTSTVAGSSWYSDGTKSASGPAGTTIRVYGTNALAGVPYQLVTGRNGVNPSQPCALDLVAVNPAVVYAGPDGLIGRVTGTVNRLPGAYQVCFAQIDPVTGNRAVTGIVNFTVT
jgi:hypothetical protein